MMVGTSNARKQRNAVVITIPAKFQIKAGQKFYRATYIVFVNVYF